LIIHDVIAPGGQLDPVQSQDRTFDAAAWQTAACRASGLTWQGSALPLPPVGRLQVHSLTRRISNCSLILGWLVVVGAWKPLDHGLHAVPDSLANFLCCKSHRIREFPRRDLNQDLSLCAPGRDDPSCCFSITPKARD
jgi:hypothetical protein